MPLPYGFIQTPDSRIIVDSEKANIVRTIYQQYLSGMSPGGIADCLFEHGVPFPQGKAHWTQPVLSNLLSDQKYIGYIVSFDSFFLVQGEKSRRNCLALCPPCRARKEVLQAFTLCFRRKDQGTHLRRIEYECI